MREIPYDDKLEGSLVAIDGLDSDEFFLLPRVETVTGTEVKVEPIGFFRERYFPRVSLADAETHRYPNPLSPEFWFEYAEPTRDVFRGLMRVYDALTALKSTGERPNATTAINAYLVDSSVVLSDTGGKIRWVWQPASLLAACAVSAARLIAEGQVVRPCDACATIFISSKEQKRYCSSQCQWRAEKARQRKKKRHA